MCSTSNSKKCMEKKKYILDYIVILFLIKSLLVSGCYSYREVSREDYLTKDRHNKSKVILNNKKEVVIEENENTKILSDSENIIIINDSSETNIPFSEINKIMEEKFDFGKTFFATFWLSLAAFVVLGLILIISGGIPTFG